MRGNAGKARNQSGISYHGGPVILGTVNVYYIWYGNWSGNTAVGIRTDLANSIGGSPYFNINSGYYQSSTTKLYVANSVAYGGSTTDNYSSGKSLSDSAIRGVVSDAITSARLPNDTNGVYFVLTSADVTATLRLGADGMASIISHELEESATDPVFNGWYDSRGAENADKCAWTFGSTYTAANGATANMKLNTAKSSRDWLIQQNWVNASPGFCAKSH